MTQPTYNYHKQEENKILEKTRRQKILEVEKLSQTIQELEEVILASGATANVLRDYQRQISELQVGISYGYWHSELDVEYTDLVLYKFSGGEKDIGKRASKSKSLGQ